MRRLFLIAFCLFIGGNFASIARAQESLALDTPTRISGVDVVCTGIASNTRDDPSWAPYPLKIEVTGRNGQYLANVRIVIQRDGAQIVDLVCGGPWILARLDAGEYTVTATFGDATASGIADVPSTGQSRLVLWFPEADGAVSPQRGFEALDDPASPQEEMANVAPALRLDADNSAAGEANSAVTGVSGGAVLQVGAYRTEASADEAWQLFRAENSEMTGSLTSDIQEANLGERGVLYRLRIGPFEDADAANVVCNEIKARGGDCFSAAP
jgi:hypothetical protein